MITVFYFLLMLSVGRCTADQIFETKTVGVGEDVTLNCNRQKSDNTGTLFWIRLVSGNFPEFLAGILDFDFGFGVVNIKTPHISAKQEPGTFILHINKTKPSDTGVYYCIKVEQTKMTFLKGTLLRIKESEPNITAIIQDHPSVPLHPGDSVTLQCSVLSDSEKKTCPGEHSVFWFRAGSDESHPSLIYAHGNRGDECEKSPEAYSPQKCVYNFSKNVSSSDAGTYYCAVATCGEILFGSGTKLDIEAFNVWDLQKANTVLFVLCAALAISLIIIAFLIYTIKKKTCDCCSASGDQQSQQRATDLLAYSAPTFNKRKTGRAERRNVKTAEEETIYTDVRTLQFVKAFCMAVVRTRSKVTCNSYTDRHKLWWAISPPFDQPSRLFTQNRPDFGLQQDV
ncbi:signal-regulatory protein beta-2-like isoform X2 [Sander vitreus]